MCNLLMCLFKMSYLMIFEVVVLIVSGLYDWVGMLIYDDEIVYIVMYVGGCLECSWKVELIFIVMIVCLGYYELYEFL